MTRTPAACVAHRHGAAPSRVASASTPCDATPSVATRARALNVTLAATSRCVRVHSRVCAAVYHEDEAGEAGEAVEAGEAGEAGPAPSRERQLGIAPPAVTALAIAPSGSLSWRATSAAARALLLSRLRPAAASLTMAAAS